MTVSISSRHRALRDPAKHVFVKGKGYVDLGSEPKLERIHGPAGRCNPPDGAADLSWHALIPPGGHPPINFQWLRRAGSWYRLDRRSRRVGYKPDYLSQSGWTYGRPANGPHC